jgi:hypothetical protein
MSFDVHKGGIKLEAEAVGNHVSLGLVPLFKISTLPWKTRDLCEEGYFIDGGFLASFFDF